MHTYLTNEPKPLRDSPYGFCAHLVLSQVDSMGTAEHRQHTAKAVNSQIVRLARTLHEGLLQVRAARLHLNPQVRRQRHTSYL